MAPIVLFGGTGSEKVRALRDSASRDLARTHGVWEGWRSNRGALLMRCRGGGHRPKCDGTRRHVTCAAATAQSLAATRLLKRVKSSSRVDTATLAPPVATGYA
jgi:CDGSH-type Zn-finger protein